MNDHAGLGCLFSVLIVIVFTVVFFEVERTEVAQSGSIAPTDPPAPAQRVAPVGPGRTAAPASPAQPALVSPGAVVQPTPAPSAVNIPLLEAIDSPRRPTGPSLVRGPARPPSLPISLVSRPGTVAPLPTPAVQRPMADPIPRGVTPEIKTDLVPPARLERRATVTTVGKGEGLVDVAVRVYGAATAATKLWRANRDRLPSLDTPVAEGWLLRTP